MNNIERIPELSVILVNFNNKSHLKECLSSLEQNTKGTILEIIIVDNNSSDGSQEFIKTQFPQVKLISNKENVGFARANNQGIRKSKGEFIFFLNPDTIVFPPALSLLLEEMKTNPQAGAVGPALLKGKNEYQVSFGRKISFFYELLQRGFFNAYYKVKLRSTLLKRDVGWLSGACLLTKRDILEEAGLFDERFFLYFEDIDLCLRIKKRGWKIIYLPQAKVFHKGGASTAPFRLSCRFEYRKSQLYFYHKHSSKVSLFMLRFYLVINFFLFFLWEFLKRDKVCFSRKRFFKLLKNYKG